MQNDKQIKAVVPTQVLISTVISDVPFVLLVMVPTHRVEFAVGTELHANGDQNDQV